MAQLQHSPTATTASAAGGIVVFGGGTATNSLVDVFESLRVSLSSSSKRSGGGGGGGQATLSYVIPISDNGGSSSELIRVFGGPGIGDVRSRLVRLIPDSETDPERASLKELFNHRLPEDHALARSEWLDIVESRHPLWGPSVSPYSFPGSSSSSNSPTTTTTPMIGGISSEKRELIRSIFNIVNMEIVKRARPSSVFNFSRASIGNLFLTGARVLTGSLESAVYLLATICGVPEHVRVVAAINSNFTHHISAGLADGSVITGQNSISHPSAPTALPDDGSSRGMMAGGGGRGDGGDPWDVRDETAMLDLIEDATLPGSLPTLRKPYITFNKGGGAAAGTLTPISSTAESSRPGSTGQRTPTITTDKVGGRTLDGEGDKLDNLSFNMQNTTLTSSPPPPPPEEPQNHSPTDSLFEKQQQQQPPSLLAGGEHPLPSRIDRIWYINPYGHEIWPPANPKVTSTLLGSASAVIYSIGSLYTSIVPSLVLRGVGAALANSRTARHKVLILNSSLDRETSGKPFRVRAEAARNGTGAGAGTTGLGSGKKEEEEVGRKEVRHPDKGDDAESSGVAHGGGDDDEDGGNDDFTAADFVRAIVRACVQSQGELPARMARRSSLSYKVRSAPGSSYPNSQQQQERQQHRDASHQSQSTSSTTPTPTVTVGTANDDAAFFDNPLVVRRYVTHLVYLEAPGAPRVDRDVLSRMGVECTRVYGRREGAAGGTTKEPPGSGGQDQQEDQQRKQGPLRYDIAGLTRALEAIVVMGAGGGEKAGLTRSRRNTSGQ